MDKEGNNALTRVKGDKFTITELEVWQIKFSSLFNREAYLKRMKEARKQNKEIFINYKGYTNCVIQ